jgi:hypothetical protein
MADGADDFTHDVGSDPQQALLNFDDEVRKLLRWIYQEHCVRSKGMLLGTLRKLLHLMPLLVPELRNTAGPTPVHIYAAGQRIAREEWGSVSFEHHNPVTGSWVTSNGHSSYRTASREERDPVGAEVPLANPYPAAQSYVDWKSTQPLFIEGGDPFDYTSGRTSMVYRYPKLSFNGELAMVVLVPVFS